ncbi:MAG TPA: aminotransferase class III-fold pyridoxal phosphate-dependent enzyme [Polyangiaceae bacterium]|nr:aminotransferase class III-fold pyridoxal phosphate-dependent enzyme [Polyangiaceae bacterium]
MRAVTLSPLLSTPVPGPRSRALSERVGAVECPAFEERRRGRAASAGTDTSAIVLGRGHEANLWDADDNRYVDLAAGFGAAILGHGPSAAHAAAKLQIDRLVQGLGDLYATDTKLALLERLAALHPSSHARVMLCQSGADAVTAGLKTAVLATGRPGIIAFEGSYHGMSYAPLAALGLKESFRAPFAAQLNPHVRFVAYPRDASGEAAALEAARDALRAGDAGAVLVEPILGRGGVHAPSRAFFTELARLARDAGALFVADEIWTGIGRSGAILRSLELGLAPDVVCIGKALGAGFPISACIASDAAMRGWAQSGEVLHTSTHAGAPFGCAVALATLDAVATDRLAERARTLGGELVASLRDELGDRATVRGEGLLVAVDFGAPGRGVAATQRLLEHGYVATAGGTAGEAVVLTPPLVIGREALLDVAPVMGQIARRTAP